MKHNFVFRGDKPHAYTILVLSLVLGGAAGAASINANWPHWVLIVLMGAGVAAPLVIDPLIARTEWKATISSVVRRAAPETINGRLPVIAELSTGALRVHPSISHLPYFRRSSHTEVKQRLKDHRRVLVAGRSMVGKTRTSLEASVELFKKRRVWRPPTAQAIVELITGGMNLKNTIIWLDDVERFCSAPEFQTSYLDLLLDAGNVVVATVRSSALETITSDTGVKNNSSQIVQWFGEPIWLPGWSADEVDAAFDAAGDTTSSDEARRHGLGAYLGGAPWLRQRLDIARSEDRLAYTLIKAVAMARRVGLQGGLPARVLADAYIAAGGTGSPSDDEVTAAREWSLETYANTVSLLSLASNDNIDVSDIVLEYFEDQENSIPKAFWDFAVAIANLDDLLNVGVMAFQDGQADAANQAWTKSNDPYAEYYLGAAMVDEGGTEAWDTAEPLLRNAIKSGVLEARISLGVLLEKRAGGTTAYVEESHRIWIESADEDPVAAFNAAVAISRVQADNWQTEAEFYYQKALRGRHRLAAQRLGYLLFEQGRVKEASQTLQLAIDDYESDIEDRALLGRAKFLLGDPIAGEILIRDALEAGSSNAVVGLAEIGLKTQNLATLTQAWAQLESMDQNDTQTTRARVAMALGLHGQAELILREMVLEKDAECTILLAEHLAGVGPLPLANTAPYPSIYEPPEETIKLLKGLEGDAEPVALSTLAQIYLHFGMGEEALATTRDAVEAGHDEARLQLATLLLSRGDSEDLPEVERIFVSELQNPQSQSDQRAALLTNLGVIERVRGNLIASKNYYQQAARAGSVPAMRNLAAILAAEKKRTRSYRWRRAAKKAEKLEPEDETFDPLDEMAVNRRNPWWILYEKRRRIRVWGQTWRSSQGALAVWAICARCGRLFAVPSGFFMGTDPELASQFEKSPATAGPCPHCWRNLRFSRGLPLLARQTFEEGFSEISGNNSAKFTSLMKVAFKLTLDQLNSSDGLTWLQSGDTSVARLGELELSNIQSAPDLGRLIAIAVAVTGPDQFTDEPIQGGTAGSLEDEDFISELIRSYDNGHLLPTVRLQQDLGFGATYD